MKKLCFLKRKNLFPAPLLVDKPTGVTSHDVVAWTRRVTGVKKVGHAGTLDPLATGLLIILIGREWTKRQSEFLKQEKTYLAGCKFGYVSDSYDIDGQIEFATDASLVSQEMLEKVIKQRFLGEIVQTVPPFSAVKRKGKKLYQLARVGQIDVETLPTRRVIVSKFRLLEFNEKEQTALFEIQVSSGTYIRSLIHDLGQVLGSGAVVTSLRRIRIGKFGVDDVFCCPNLV